MDKLREFQAKQRASKDDLEKKIKQERFQLEQKHRNEKTELDLKHARMRNQLKSRLIAEREQRSNEKEQKKTAKRKANIEDELLDLLCQEEEQKKKKQRNQQSDEIVFADVTNKPLALLTVISNNEPYDEQILEIVEAKANSTLELASNEIDPNETLDLCTINPTQMAENLFKIN